MMMMMDEEEEGHLCKQCKARVLPKPARKSTIAKVGRPIAVPVSTKRPIAESDVLGNDLDIPRLKPILKRARPESDCPEQLTDRQVKNMHVKFLQLICKSKKEAELWASPVAHAFPPSRMATCRLKELLEYRRGNKQPIPKQLAVRIFMVFRGFDSIKIKKPA
jgi:hypothetical protein